MEERILYLGLRPPQSETKTRYLHYPVIRTEILPPPKLVPCSHMLFTSQTGVEAVLEWGWQALFLECSHYAVGKRTAEMVERHGGVVQGIADPETAEGLCSLLDYEPLEGRSLFWPHSSLSRLLIKEHLEEKGVDLSAHIAYQTHFQEPLPRPDLEEVDALFFSSPSTVEGFLQIFGKIPRNLRCITQGPVTQNKLESVTLREKNS